MLSDRLRYFLAAARLEHFGRAADELGLSQPALSRSIRKLETEVGAPLFDRMSGGVTLNPAGKILMERALQANESLEDAQREIAERRESASQTIALGYLATFGIRLVPETVKAFRTLQPDIRFKLFEGPTSALKEMLERGEIDVCMASSFSDPVIDWHFLFTEELFAVVAHDHPLANEESIELADLADEDFVAMKPGHCLRDSLEILCKHAGFEPRIAFEAADVPTLRGLAAAGFGVGLAPRREVEPHTLAVTLRINSPVCERQIGLSWRKGRWQSPNVQQFRDFVISNVQSRWQADDKGRATNWPVEAAV